MLARYSYCPTAASSDLLRTVKTNRTLCQPILRGIESEKTMYVKQIMTRNPDTVTSQDSLRQAIALMQQGEFRRLPVVENQCLVGIITDRDVRLAINSPVILREKWYDEYLLDNVTVGACMTPNPITVTPDTSVEDAARLMRDRKVGGLPVTQGNELVGIITETDVLNYLIELLEIGDLYPQASSLNSLVQFDGVIRVPQRSTT